MSNMQSLNSIIAVTELTDEAAANCAGGFTMTILKENGYSSAKKILIH